MRGGGHGGSDRLAHLPPHTWRGSGSAGASYGGGGSSGLSGLGGGLGGRGSLSDGGGGLSRPPELGGRSLGSFGQGYLGDGPLGGYLGGGGGDYGSSGVPGLHPSISATMINQGVAPRLSAQLGAAGLSVASLNAALHARHALRRSAAPTWHASPRWAVATGTAAALWQEATAGWAA